VSRKRTLNDADRASLRASGLTDETIKLAGVYSVEKATSVKGIKGLPSWGGGYVFPFRDPNQKVALSRVRIRNAGEGVPKYLGPKGVGIAPYLPPRSLADGRYRDPAIPLLFTEGEKKALLGDQLGYAVIGSTGVDCFHDSALKKATGARVLHPWVLSLCGDLEGRECIMLFDADAAQNPGVKSGAARLRGMLEDQGAKVRGLVFPPPVGDDNKAGIDDYFVAHGEDATRAVIEGDALDIEPIPTGADALLGKARIIIDKDEHRVVADCLEALAAHGEVYERGGVLVRIARSGRDAAAYAHTMTKANVREALGECALPVKAMPTGFSPCVIPERVVSMIHETQLHGRMRALYAISCAPVMRRDGTIATEPGYDSASGVYIDADEPFIVPDKPTPDDVRSALELLAEAVVDFPFAHAHHFSAWLASLFTVAGRHAFDGPAPMYLFEAPSANSGKTMLATTTGVIGAGKYVSPQSYNRDETEMRKKVTSIAMSGVPVVLLDNVTGTLGGDSLCQMLTSVNLQWSDRILGISRMWQGEFRGVWFATGNNCGIGPDMSRRILPIRLDAGLENPDQREFRHPDLMRWLADNRAALSSAPATILRAFHLAGRPSSGTRPKGSYERWQWIRDAVIWLGFADPNDAAADLKQRDFAADLDSQIVTGVADIIAANGGLAMTTRQILSRIENEDGDLLETLRQISRNGLSSRSLGRMLSQREGMIRGGVCVRRSGKAHQAVLWITARAESDAVRAESGGVSGEFGELRKTNSPTNSPSKFLVLQGKSEKGSLGSLDQHLSAHARVEDTSITSSRLRCENKLPKLPEDSNYLESQGISRGVTRGVSGSLENQTPKTPESQDISRGVCGSSQTDAKTDEPRLAITRPLEPRPEYVTPEERARRAEEDRKARAAWNARVRARNAARAAAEAAAAAKGGSDAE
jgi:hypothetical protein